MEETPHRYQPDFLALQRGTKSLFSTGGGSTQSTNNGSNSSIDSSINNSHSGLGRPLLSPVPSSAVYPSVSTEPMEASPQPTPNTTPPSRATEGGATPDTRLGPTDGLPFPTDNGFRIPVTPEIVNSISRERVACRMGCSIRDWSYVAQQKKEREKVECKRGVITRGGNPLPRMSPTDVERHAPSDDLWLVIRGVVYDCTAFQYFHPGGGRLLKQCSGKDCTALYDRYHRWVSCEAFLAPFAVGEIVTSHTPQ